MIIGTPPTLYLDGGLGYNNPIRTLMDEVMHLLPGKSIEYIVSIGTGIGLSKDIGRSMGTLIRTLTEISTDTENMAREFNEEVAYRFPKIYIYVYFRFNVHRGLEHVALEEWKEMGRIKIVTEDYLNEKWRQVGNCATQLCAPIENDVSTESVTFILSLNHAVLSFLKVISSFVGRTSQLGELEAKLFPKNQCTKFAIIGLGGIGKTQIALELAYRMRDNYSEGSIFWMPATNPESLQQAYLKLARQLRIPGVVV
ncbi:hypothetical protein MMC29_002746 [Sticta canariensis]|nr:hypothetical protein [Sticta canariensis]